ncbi:sodium/pantothenate symporter [Methylibium sp.]|uniref:sodium/pantothenate symporter n=1 Tax=Methylibium sp. TaxID=2067992 RepID=UPI0018211AD0|nr:sodium/pantothenate symporter [Methylibium sp.]MBA3590305.1 sodium/panthothenate symporter [Methylibium sp.]
MNTNTLQWDLIVPFGVYLLLTLGVAIFARTALTKLVTSGKNFMSEYYIGGRTMGPVVLAFTFVATFASAGTFIGYPGLAYKNGLTVVMTGISQITLAYVAFSIIGKRMCILGHRTGAVTYTEIMRRRFDHPVLVVGITVAIILFFGAFMVAQFAGAARILQSIAGVPYGVGVLLFGGSVALTVVIGGFRAVTWTDTLQGVVMVLGVLIVVPAFFIFAGGPDLVTSRLLEADSARVFGPGPGGWASPSVLIGFWILWVLLAVGNPSLSMRFMAARDTRTIHRAMIIAAVIGTVFYVPMFYFGAAIYTVFPDLPPDVAVPRAYLASLPGWLAGICLAAPFAAVMSTVDSLLLTASSALVRDIYQGYINPEADPKRLSQWSYVISACIGIGVLWLALTPPQLIATVVIYFAGGVASAFVVPLLAMLFWPRATTWGAIASVYGGIAIFLLIDIYAKNPLGVLSYLWALGASALLMWSVSLVTRPASRAVLELYYGKSELQEVPVVPPNRKQEVRYEF